MNIKGDLPAALKMTHYPWKRNEFTYLFHFIKLLGKQTLKVVHFS